MRYRLYRRRYRRRPRLGSGAFAVIVGLALIYAAAAHLPQWAFGLVLLLAVGAVPGGVAWRIWRRVHRWSRLRACGIPDIDRMTGATFEMRLAVAFSDLGYRVRHTGRSGDFGCDLVAERGGEQILVQAKRWQGSVGIAAVQQIHAARAVYGQGRAVVICPSHFTPAALQLAQRTGVECWGRPQLERLLLDAQRRRMRAA